MQANLAEGFDLKSNGLGSANALHVMIEAVKVAQADIYRCSTTACGWGSTSPYPDNVNDVGTGKMPILNNSPVIVFKDGKLAFVSDRPAVRRSARPSSRC